MNKIQKIMLLGLSVLVFGLMLYAGNSERTVDVTVTVTNSAATQVTATPTNGGMGGSGCVDVNSIPLAVNYRCEHS